MTDSIKLTSSEIEIICKAGSHAPSAGNSQAWLLKIVNNEVLISLDKKRISSFKDVGLYIALFGLGCFVENIRIALEYLHFVYEINFPEENDISVKFVITDKNGSGNGYLYNYLDMRMTNRKLSDGTLLSKEQIESLKNVVTDFDSDYKVSLTSDFGQKNAIASAIGIADRIRVMDDSLFSEMMSEFRWSEEEAVKTKDGLDLTTLEFPRNLGKMFALLRENPFIRTLIPQQAFLEIAKPLILNSSHVACLAIKEKPTEKALIRGGIVMERLWLHATKAQIDLHPWSASTFLLMQLEIFNGHNLTETQKHNIYDMGSKIRELFHLDTNQTPLLIFRLSHSHAPTARSLRRDWHELLRLQ